MFAVINEMLKMVLLILSFMVLSSCSERNETNHEVLNKFIKGTVLENKVKGVQRSGGVKGVSYTFYILYDDVFTPSELDKLNLMPILEPEARVQIFEKSRNRFKQKKFSYEKSNYYQGIISDYLWAEVLEFEGGLLFFAYR